MAGRGSGHRTFRQPLLSIVQTRLLDTSLTALFTFSLFGLLALALNNGAFPPNVLSTGFYGVYFGILGFDYRGYYGVQAAEWFVLMIIAFAGMDRKAGRKAVFVHLLALSSILTSLYEIGLLVSIPGFASEWVMQWQYGTPLQWFSNLDLLLLALFVLSALTGRWLANDGRQSRS